MSDTPLIPPEFLAALPTYRTHRLPKAAKVIAVTKAVLPIGALSRLDLEGGGHVEVTPDWLIENQPETGGYVVFAADAGASFLSAAKFEIQFRRVEGLRYGEAIEAMKRGYKLRRRRWHEKSFLILVQPAPDVKLRAGTVYSRALGEGEVVTINAHFSLFSPMGHFQPGWLPSTADMLASDWEVLP